MMEQEGRNGSTYAPVGNTPFHPVSLRNADGERRLPVDIVREDILPLSTGTWVAFHNDELGDPPAYAIDLLRRLESLKCRWVGPASLSFAQSSTLLPLAEQSGCRGLLFDGGTISAHYLTTETSATPESLQQLATSLRTLSLHGIMSITHFVFGYDSDDEGVFERTVRFCQEARIGLPYFSLLTPTPGTPLFSTLEREGRVLQTERARYDGAHAVFRPRLMTPEALENGFHWARQQVYSREAIWRRTFAWKGSAFRNLLANYAQRRQFANAPRGSYTDTMRLLRQLSQPIPVRE